MRKKLTKIRRGYIIHLKVFESFLPDNQRKKGKLWVRLWDLRRERKPHFSLHQCCNKFPHTWFIIGYGYDTVQGQGDQVLSQIRIGVCIQKGKIWSMPIYIIINNAQKLVGSVITAPVINRGWHQMSQQSTTYFTS